METLIDAPRTDRLQAGLAQKPQIAVQGKQINRNYPKTGRQPCGGAANRGRAPAQNRNQCSKCQRPHLGECRLGTNVCYNCGQIGHFAPDAVVTGTLPVFGHLAFVLFDSGSTHSFVSEKFVDLAHLEKEPLETILSVSTPPHEL